MPTTLNELLTEAVVALRARNMARLRELQKQVDNWLLDHDTRDAHSTVLTALTEVLEG